MLSAGRASARVAIAGAMVGMSVAGLMSPAASGVGTFDPVVILGTGSSAGTISAVTVAFPDGGTLTAWPSNDGKGVFARARAAGTSTWGPVRGRALASGFSLVGALSFGPTVNLVVSGPHRVLLSWTEQSGAITRAMTSELSESLPSIPAAITLSKADVASGFRLTSNASGRAVAVWANTSGSSGPIRTAIRPSGSAPWGAPLTLTAGGTSAVEPQAAVTPSGAVCVEWTALLPAPQPVVQSRCRATNSFGPVTAVVHPGKAVVGSRTSLVASPHGFDLVVMVEVPGANGFPSNPAYPSTRVQLFTRNPTAGPWRAVGVEGPAGRVVFDPEVAASPNGRLLVQFRTLDGTIGSSTSVPRYTLSTYVTEKALSGVWTMPTFLGGYGVANSVYLGLYTGRPAIGNDGTAVVPVLIPTPGSTWRLDAYLRKGATGRFSPASVATSTILGLPAVSSSGRVTLGMYDFLTHNELSRSTPLPKPVALQRAAMSAAPRVNVTAQCAVAWSDAASASITWLRDGALIPGATTSTYRPRGADQGHLLSCRARAVNAAGATLTTSLARRVS